MLIFLKLAIEKMGFAILSPDVSAQTSRCLDLRKNHISQVLRDVFKLMAAEGQEYIDYIRCTVGQHEALRMQTLLADALLCSFRQALEGVPDHLRSSW
jgi:hypothetical protein